jgi:N-glycosylase/DNA lyase
VEQPPTPTAPTGETLYVVSCTRSKVWDDSAAGAPRFVPAERAYTGRSLRDWLESVEARSGARWLILSARYGFIEPDHPVCAYDVTFSDAATGPVDDATLRAQVMHQTRWADGRRLDAVEKVVVLGSQEYLRRTRQAYAGTGIAVVSWEERGAPPAGSVAPIPSSQPALVESAPEDRAVTIGRALGELPARVYESADRFAPEWALLRQLGDLPDGLDVMTTLALALSDFQLGAGGAESYWQEAARLYVARPIASIPDLHDFMRALMKRPVASRMAEMKLGRVQKLLGSGIHDEVAGGITSVHPDALWSSLARLYGGERSAKTVVFAVKTIGLLHLATTDRRLPLPADLPIPVDLRIGRVTLAAGLIEPLHGLSVVQQMEAVEDFASDHRSEIIHIWQAVAREVGLSAPEIDTLLWELAVPLHAARQDRNGARRRIRDALVHAHGATAGVAQSVADALTHALPQGTPPR